MDHHRSRPVGRAPVGNGMGERLVGMTDGLPCQGDGGAPKKEVLRPGFTTPAERAGSEVEAGGGHNDDEEHGVGGVDYLCK